MPLKAVRGVTASYPDECRGYMATHTDNELDKVLEICHSVGKEMKLL
ncbi:MAG: hypothetical protein AB1599_04640 [Planctomycetota bacterium]